MTTELTTTDASPLVAVLSDPERLNQLDTDKLKELMVMQERMEDRQAQREFASAFNAVQHDMAPVRRNARNSHTASMYARAEDIDKMLDPILVKHGFSVSFSTDTSKLDDHILVVMTVRHTGGYREVHSLDAPVDDKGIKGSATKTRIHGMASSLTYCKRHLKCSVFDVQLSDDDDGNRAGMGESAEPITNEQLSRIVDLMNDVDADVPKFTQFFKIDGVSDLPQSRYNEAVTMLEAKRK